MDANALFNYYINPKDHGQKGTLVIRRLVANAAEPVLLSQLTILECCGVLMKYQRKKLLKEKQVRKIFKRLLHRDVDVSHRSETRRRFQVVPFPEGIFRRAENLLLTHAGQWNIQSNDALHVAITEKLQADYLPIMATSDKAMKHVCNKMGISVFDAEQENPSR